MRLWLEVQGSKDKTVAAHIRLSGAILKLQMILIPAIGFYSRQECNRHDGSIGISSSVAGGMMTICYGARARTLALACSKPILRYLRTRWSNTGLWDVPKDCHSIPKSPLNPDSWAGGGGAFLLVYVYMTPYTPKH